MTEKELRNKVVNTMVDWIGCKESEGSHRKIIDLYNSHKPLARGYKLQYSDAWCAGTVSAAAIACGLTDIMPTECSCSMMISLYQKLGHWQENDDYVPQTGDVIFYDWDDNGIGDNHGSSDHVGVIVYVSSSTIRVIEGNKNNAVGYRSIAVNGKYIRGYGLPDYASKADSDPNPAPAKPENRVLPWQKAAIADGFTFPKYGADGEWGAECVSVSRKAICKRRTTYQYKNLTKIVQEAVGATVDGLFGKNTEAAVKSYQKKHGLTVDGIVGANTWKRILGV